ncbi:hypothetical protein [Flavobacterium sp.]|uniref:hypothetical protein n=1 Tax=Flavobacterium sp. TaxID=239 RepID=UPI003BE10512
MSEHPEIIPNFSPYDKFPFSAKASLKVKSDLETQLQNLNERIEKISSSVNVGDVPLVRFVLQTSHDKIELKKFAKAVDRVADLIDIVDQLESKLKIIETAQKDPSWFAFAFGDFSEEIDKDIDNIFN